MYTTQSQRCWNVFGHAIHLDWFWKSCQSEQKKYEAEISFFVSPNEILSVKSFGLTLFDITAVSNKHACMRINNRQFLLVHLSRSTILWSYVVRRPSVVVNFSLLLWHRRTKFNETLQEARSQCPLPSVCLSDRKKTTRWLPWPLIGRGIFDFSSETAERNSIKVDSSDVQIMGNNR